MRACILDERGGTHLRLQWIKIAQTALLSIGIATVLVRMHRVRSTSGSRTSAAAGGRREYRADINCRSPCEQYRICRYGQVPDTDPFDRFSVAQ